VSEHPHGATTIHASKGGGGGAKGAKWLIGGVAAVLLAGAGYFAWQNYGPSQSNTEIAAADDPYADEPLAAASYAPSEGAPANEAPVADDSVAAPAAAEARRRTTARSAPVPEETIGVTPINATTSEDAVAVADSDEIVVTAPRRPIWASTPTQRRLSALYPERALERGREGEARLTCIVQAGGALDCQRVSETPGGFGAAAVRVARTFRHSPTLADGSDAVGSPVNLRVIFRLEDDGRRRG
jgi:TonB family protein